MKFKLVAAAAAAALLGSALAAAPASAITGGEADTTHTGVGMITWYDKADGKRYRCTATLVAPKVLITAAHCTKDTAGETLVTFSDVVAMTQPKQGEPSALPTADDLDPTTNTSGTGFQKPPSFTYGNKTWYSGIAHTHPDYSDFTDMANWNDVGVVVLDEAPPVPQYKIAALNYLDQFQQPKLNSTLFEIVGYGTEVRKPETGKQKPTAFGYPLYRRHAFAPGQKLTPQILQVNGNPNDTKGTGGSCFGDSGGPTFKDGMVVTVTSYGYTDDCRYLDGLQRVDIKAAQDWLATFGVTP